MQAMARVTIELPAQWSFTTELDVRITDINYGRHVGNDALVGLLHEARIRWVRSLGYASELLAEPVGLIMVDLAVRFKAEVEYGDVLRFQLAPGDWSRLGFGLTYLATRVADGAEVARARTGMAFFDYAKKKLSAPPPGFRERAG
jgi:acyl-CoA thioesterase FadM